MHELISAASQFDVEELFFSVTDRRGRIRTGNQVFVRVAGYGADEMLDQPHSLVRHPDTPRAVFALLWSELGEGRTVAAYVMNRTKAGDPYWVVATAAPIADGHLSVRLKPTSSIFPAIVGVYERVRAVERRAEAAGMNGGEAAQHGLTALGQELTALGFDDYASFMRTFLPAEIRSRTAQISARRGGFDRPAPDALRVELDRPFVAIDSFTDMHRSLVQKSEFILDLADEISHVSMNALLRSGRVTGVQGATVRALANLLRDGCTTSVEITERVIVEVADTQRLLAEVDVTICLAKLQSDMAAVAREESIIASSQHWSHDESRGHVTSSDGSELTLFDERSALEPVIAALTATAERLTRLLLDLDAGFGRLRNSVEQLATALAQLSSLSRSGRIETNRTSDDDGFIDLFDTLSEDIAAAQKEIGELRTSIDGQRVLHASNAWRSLPELVGEAGPVGYVLADH